MNRRSSFFAIAIPLALFLIGAVLYQYGYQGVQKELAERQDALSIRLKALARSMTLIAEGPSIERNLAALPTR